jgi:hypothetical protein
MGLPELLMIVASVGVAAAVVGLLHLLARTGRCPMLPTRWNPLAVSLAMSFGSALVLIGFVAISPSSATADRAVAPEPEPDPQADKRPKVHVYEFECYGTNLRRKDVGSDLARGIRDLLTKRGIVAPKGVEHNIPLDIFHTEETPDELIAHYRRRAPFTCAWGSVAPTRDGNLEIQVTVGRVDRTVRPTELLARTITVPDSDSSIEQATKDLAAAIADAMASD